MHHLVLRIRPTLLEFLLSVIVSLGDNLYLWAFVFDLYRMCLFTYVIRTLFVRKADINKKLFFESAGILVLSGILHLVNVD
jgi:hypothetical protein